MAQTYNIYVINKSADTQNFWLFLKPPQAMEADPAVFANSSACLTIDSNSQSLNNFGIPLQYRVGSGASNQAVGLDVQISSNVSLNAEINQAFQANYQETVPPKKGPTMKQTGASTKDGTIQITSNNFDKSSNEENSWFSNMSFGIQSAAGFIGMTWSPAPGVTRTLEPKFSFYISTGSFDYNSLAQWTDVSSQAATVELSDFKQFNCTVTLLPNGKWDVTPGRPPQKVSAQAYQTLVSSHQALCNSHAELISLANAIEPLGDGLAATAQLDLITEVDWDNQLKAVNGPLTFLSGSLRVGTALAAGFGFFILSGVRFTIKNSGSGGTQFDFEYNGTQSAQNIKELLHAGVEAEFRK